MSMHKTITLALLVAASTPAGAQEAAPLPAPGAETRSWLELQQGNAAAATGTPQAMPGEVANAVYARYLQSFSHPIPEKFERDSFTGGSK